MPEKERYLFIDGWRGIAILAVIFHHSHQLLVNYPIENTLRAIFTIGYLGVDMFFVTSGFLITGLLIQDFDSHIRVGRFYARRFFKIFPPYLCLILVAFWVNPRYDTNHYSPLTYGSYFFLWQNYVGPIETLSHTWSLSVEEHFYLFYPLLLMFICLIEKDKQKRRRMLMAACVILILSVILIRFVEKRHEINMATISQTTHYRVDAIIFGCLLKTLEPYYRGRDSKLWKGLAFLFFIAGVMIYVGFILKYVRVPWSYILAYVAPGLLFVASFGSGWLRKVLEVPPLRWIGRNSYGIYLWHYLLAYVFFEILKHQPKVPPPLVFFGAYVLTAIGVGALLTYLIEGYFLRLRGKIVP